MENGLINNDFLRSDCYFCLLAPQVSSFELGICEWRSDQPAKPAQWAQLQAEHKIASCSFLKDWSNKTEGGDLI